MNKSALCLLLVTLLIPSLVLAEDASVLLQFEQQIESMTNQWLVPLRRIANGLLVTLGTISIGWIFITMMIKGYDLPDILFELVRFIMFFGFFYALIQNANEWPRDIIDSFIQSGVRVTIANNGVGGSPITSVSSSQIMERGFALSDKIMQANEGWLFDNLAFFIVAIIVVIIYAIVAAMVMLTVVEMYIVLTGGVLVLGFAGTPWTSDYAKKYIVYTVSVGMKMFMTMLVVGMSETFISNWVSSGDRELDEGSSALAIVAILILFVYLVVKIPDFVQSLITGASLGGSTSSVAAGMAAAKAGAAMASGGVSRVASAAAQGGSSVANASRLNSASGAAGSGAAAAFATAKNLGSAAMQTAGQRLQGKGADGESSKRHFGVMEQVNDNLKNSIEKANAVGKADDTASSGTIGGGSSYKSPAAGESD